MKVLWFTNTTSLYKKDIKGYNGGGWIESLEKIISKENDIELAVSFFDSDDCFKVKKKGTTYYPIPLYKSIFKKIKYYIFPKKLDNSELNSYLKIIEDFKPDVIHVFGTEKSFGLLTLHTKTPLVIHLQGILNPCLNSFYAPGFSQIDLIKQHVFKPLKIINQLFGMYIFKNNVKRESIILKNCKYYMGRTEWDKSVTNLYAPNSTYFYCSEMLREDFYTARAWKAKEDSKLILVSTISKTSYKGFDLILKTAKLLKELTEIDFEWRVFGLSEYKDMELKLGINCEHVNVLLKGVVKSEILIQNIQAGDIFIHPSYIDNSPNSICEAQLIGIPVISTNVGGVSSLIKNDMTGYLVPSNDPFTLASKVIKLKKNKIESIKISKISRETAILRHDKQTIVNDLLKIYNTITNA